MSKPAFHYCSLDKFESIIKSHTIRLYDITKMNDETEWKWIWEFLEEGFEGNGLHWPDVKAEMLSYDRVKELLNDPQIFAACFSLNGDLLSQWRGYADDGSGVAIGFSRDTFKTYTFLETDKVKYKEKEHRLYVDSIIEDHSIISDAIGKMLGKTNYYDLLKFREIELPYDEVLFNIYEGAPFIKHYSFSEEAEWRIIANKRILDSEADEARLTYIPFNISRGENRAYYQLDFEKDKQRIIKEIYIGPKCKLTENDIYLFLTTCGYSISIGAIHKSKIPYI